MQILRELINSGDELVGGESRCGKMTLNQIKERILVSEKFDIKQVDKAQLSTVKR